MAILHPALKCCQQPGVAAGLVLFCNTLRAWVKKAQPEGEAKSDMVVPYPLAGLPEQPSTTEHQGIR